MPLYCGIDLHSTNCYLAVLDELDLPQFGGRFRAWVRKSSSGGCWGAEPPSTKVLRKRVAGHDLASCYAACDRRSNSTGLR